MRTIAVAGLDVAVDGQAGSTWPWCGVGAALPVRCPPTNFRAVVPSRDNMPRSGWNCRHPLAPGLDPLRSQSPDRARAVRAMRCGTVCAIPLGMKKQRPTLESLQAQIAELRAVLGPQGRLARGTIAAPMVEALPDADTQPDLLFAPTPTTVIARQLGVTEQAAEIELRAREKKGEVRDVGTALAGALWIRPVGDETPTKTLLDQIRALISVRPMTEPELRAATGARRNRIRGTLNRLQRDKTASNLQPDKREGLYWIG